MCAGGGGYCTISCGARSSFGSAAVSSAALSSYLRLHNIYAVVLLFVHPLCCPAASELTHSLCSLAVVRFVQHDQIQGSPSSARRNCPSVIRSGGRGISGCVDSNPSSHSSRNARAGSSDRWLATSARRRAAMIVSADSAITSRGGRGWRHPVHPKLSADEVVVRRCAAVRVPGDYHMKVRARVVVARRGGSQGSCLAKFCRFGICRVPRVPVGMVRCCSRRRRPVRERERAERSVDVRQAAIDAPTWRRRVQNFAILPSATRSTVTATRTHAGSPNRIR